jgi:type IV pilus assembly protein PilM
MLQLPLIEDEKELDNAVRFRAQDQFPMPLDQAVLDHRVVSKGTGPDGERQMEVLAVAARRDMVLSLLKTAQDAGLRPVGMDLSAFGMIRALAGTDENGVGAGGFVAAPPASSYEQRMADGGNDPVAGQEQGPARLYCHLGDVVNLAVAQGRTCVFTRTSPFGIEGIAQKLSERHRLTLEHSRQWMSHVGLDRPLEQVDGDAEIVSAAREALEDGAKKLADELRLSLQYYGAQDHALAVEKLIACGPGTTIPGLVERLQRDLGQPFAIANPPSLATVEEPLRARLAVSYGLALEE